MLVVGNKLQAKVFKDIKIGTPFYRYNRDYGHNVLYMKTERVRSEDFLGQTKIVREYNTVNIESGNLAFMQDDDMVIIANVHVECDSKI